MNQQLLESNNWEILLWLIRRRKRFRVSGNSMLPLLQPGEEILVDLSAYQKAHPQVGDIIVANHPHRPNYYVVKRIRSIRNNCDFFLVGDNYLESTDSRSFGAVTLDNIIGKVTSRLT